MPSSTALCSVMILLLSHLTMAYPEGCLVKAQSTDTGCTLLT